MRVDGRSQALGITRTSFSPAEQTISVSQHIHKQNYPRQFFGHIRQLVTPTSHLLATQATPVGSPFQVLVSTLGVRHVQASS